MFIRIAIVLLAMGVASSVSAESYAQIRDLANSMGLLGGAAQACDAPHSDIQMYSEKVGRGLDEAGPFSADQIIGIGAAFAAGMIEGKNIQSTIKQTPCSEVLRVWRKQPVWKQ